MKKLYLSNSDLIYGGASWRAAAKRIGATITPIKTSDAIALPLREVTTRDFCNKGYLPSNWMVLLDRIALLEAGIPTLPTVAPMSIADDIPFDGPVFVKPRHTNRGTSKYAYTFYDSVDNFRSSVQSDFWEYQNEAKVRLEEYILNPAIVTPFDCLETCFAINSLGIVKTVFSNSTVHDGSKLLGNGKPTELPNEVLTLVETTCNTFSIKNALISIQFVQYKGKWVAMDWHLRPPAVFSEGLLNDYPGACDAGLAHMLDGEVDDIPFYWEQRAYWEKGIPNALRPIAIKLGLIPRAIQEKTFGRVVAAGESKEVVQEKLDKFEEILCLSVISQP